MSAILLSKNNLNDIYHYTTPVVVEYFATWCPKCALMNPIYEKVANQLDAQIIFFKIDVDTIPEHVHELGLEIYPTFIVYQKGKILGYTSGVFSANALTKILLEICKL